jgi:hypothetical protein
MFVFAALMILVRGPKPLPATAFAFVFVTAAILYSPMI